MRFFPFAAIAVLCARTMVEAFSLSMVSEQQSTAQSRRAFVVTSVGSVISTATASLQPTGRAEAAAPTVYKLNNGVKYAITKDVSKGSLPQEGDIVAIEYTGYLTSGAIFDATHSEGKKNSLLFKLGR